MKSVLSTKESNLLEVVAQFQKDRAYTRKLVKMCGAQEKDSNRDSQDAILAAT